MFDTLIVGFDKALRTLCVEAQASRKSPGDMFSEAPLSDSDRVHAGALMRINHVGEVCAQALYQGQAIASGNRAIQLALDKAAAEETDHLGWTERRISELGARKSLLNPVWYAGAFSIGVLAGRCGDSLNLGFLEETERQVEAHLKHHLTILPTGDAKSSAIVRQMILDEVDHAETAARLGARSLPSGVKLAMRVVARVMTRTAYYV